MSLAPRRKSSYLHAHTHAPTDPCQFRRPLTELAKETLRVHNPNNTPVAFKVKTTAPKLYCVRPNSGRIEAGQEVEVQVLLQAMKEEPPADYKCRDKFLVQSTAITPELESTNISNLWAEVESRGQHQIHERKIRCVFVAASEDKAAAAATTTTTTTTSPDTSASAVNVSTTDYTAEPPLESSFRSTAQSPAVSRLSQPQQSQQPRESQGGDVARVASSASPRDDDLANARREIGSLRDEIESLKAKARRAAASVGTPASSTQLQAQGVPVHISALIALVAFLAAYLLF